jgi:ATP-dependent DNA helicase RecG
VADSLSFFDAIDRLPGIGTARRRELRAAGIETIEDLLNVLPRRYVDRSHIVSIGEVKEGEAATIIGAVRAVDVRTLPRKRIPLVTVTLFDGTGYLSCQWFGRRYLADTFRDAGKIAVSGRVRRIRGKLVIDNPDYDVLDEEDERGINTGGIVPVYPSLGSVKTYGLRRLVRRALSLIETVPEVLPLEAIAKHGFIPRDAMIRELHFPTSFVALEEARRRYLYEELFFLQAGIAEYRVRFQRQGEGYAHAGSMGAVSRFLDALGIRLTQSQETALSEIIGDLSSSTPMNRLFEGDVGSGKTAVALAAATFAASGGGQVAYMVPTEVLAEQQFEKYAGALEHAGVRARVLTGSTPAKAREEILRGLLEGSIDIVFGTHALLYDEVSFRNLTFAIIDEQHRFGTEQRQALMKKGTFPDVLLMTATPIPRTLALTVFGDLDMSVIKGRPRDAGMSEKVTTKVLREASRERAYAVLKGEVEKGRQGFVIVPLVEESAAIEGRALADARAFIERHVGANARVVVLHGRMKPDEKRAAMAAFRDRQADILVSTTVVEVGIDVPNATVMIVENAERFGLAQLHQLRGRIGRGELPGYMFALCGTDSEEAVGRLRAFVKSKDGFELAEQDLLLRGEGEILGVRQSGASSLRLARFARHKDVVEMARADAFAFVEVHDETSPSRRVVQREVSKRYNQIDLIFVS